MFPHDQIQVLPLGKCIREVTLWKHEMLICSDGGDFLNIYLLFFKIYLFWLRRILVEVCGLFFFFLIYFWLCWVFVAARRLSLVAVSGGYSSLRCTGFSLRWLLLLRSTGFRRKGFSSCGSRALEHRLSSCGAQAQLLSSMWDLPGPGLEPESPALAGGFLTTAQPGKSPCGLLSCGMHVGSSSPIRDQTRVPCIGSTESYPLDHQGSPYSGDVNFDPWLKQCLPMSHL